MFIVVYFAVAVTGVVIPKVALESKASGRKEWPSKDALDCQPEFLGFQFSVSRRRCLSKNSRGVTEPWRQIGHKGNVSMRVNETIGVGGHQDQDG